MTCIIIDDEPLARKGIRLLINGQPDVQFIKDFSSARNAAEYLQSHAVDLIFLDIELTDENGLEFSKTLPDNTMVIFTTAYSQYALESYEVEAIDYLVKPISPERFQKAIAKAQLQKEMMNAFRNTLESVSDNSIVIRSDRRFHKLIFDEILFISGLKDYVVIYTVNGKLLTNLNLKNMNNKLPSAKFIRVSKSYIINKDLITSFDSSTIFIGDHEIPIGRVYQKDFLDGYLKK